MRNLLSEHRKHLILSCILILLPAILCICLNPQAWGWYAGMTTLFLVTHLICLIFTCRDTAIRRQNRKVLGLIWYTTPAIAVVTDAILFLAMTRSDIDGIIVTITMLFIGLLFLVFGIFMPRTKQNRIFGVRIKWALENEDNWNATHRFTGKLWIICGFASMLCVFIPGEYLRITIFTVILVIACVGSILYSWRYHRRHL